MSHAPYPTLEALQRAVDAAAGRRPGDLLLRGGSVLNVFTGRCERADVLLAGSLVAAVGALGDAVPSASSTSPVPIWLPASSTATCTSSPHW
jgi:adenine deaminase